MTPLCTSTGTLAERIERTGIVAITLGSGVRPPSSGGAEFMEFATPDETYACVDPAKANCSPLRHALRSTIVIVSDTAVAADLLAAGLQPALFFCCDIARTILDGGQGTTAESRSYLGGPRRVLRTGMALDAEIGANGLSPVFQLESNLVPVVIEMQRRGLKVDREAWSKCVAEQDAQAKRLGKHLTAELGVPNLRDHEQVRAALQGRLGALRDTSKETLLPFTDDPLVAELLAYRRADAFVTGTGIALLRALETSNDGRVHAEFRQLAAPTGRLSCASPNLMAVPKIPELRTCVSAGPGRVVIAGDYVALELRVLADHVNEPGLKQVFARRDGDPHRHTASLLAKKPEAAVSSVERRKAKAINFGVVFGMGASTLADYARGTFRADMKVEEAAAHRELFLREHPRIAIWHHRERLSPSPSVRSVLGRVRYFGETSTLGARLNTPIQATAADGLKLAMVNLAPKLAPYDAHLLLSVHDELLIDAPHEAARDVMRLVSTTMRDGMQEFVRDVPVVVEMSMAATWGGAS